MSESAVLTPCHSSHTVYLKDYQVPTYFIDEIDLTIDLYEEETYVKSHMRIRHNRLSPNPARDLVLYGEELTLKSITVDGKELAANQYELTPHTLVLRNMPDKFELETVTKIYPQKNTALSGLYRSAGTYCTQCEAEGFRRITYYMDQPDILARFITIISADEKRYPILLSNGNLIAQGKLENGRHWVKWEDPFKKPSYLFALVAGDFDLIEDTFTTQSDREINLRIYVEKGYADQAHHAMYSVKEAMRWDEKAYGREYDLDVYMIVAIGDFNMGAMENKGLNIFNTKYVLAKPETATDDDYIHILSVVGHEYFHNWSGNRVTCRDWFQLSLKEGLTIFRDQSFTEDVLSKGVMRIRDVTALRETQFPEDAGPLAHPVRPESYMEINNFYTSTVYNKGAEVLRMLQTILGPNLFRKGMDLYFARHDGQAVTIEDYVETMEDVSGIDLQQFRLWYSQAGTPVVTISDDYDAKEKIYTLTVSQTCPETPGQTKKLPFYIPIKIALLNEQGEEMLLHIGDEPVSNEKILALKESSQIFRFKQVESNPIPSLLRNFSAPIKLNYAYSDKQLEFLFKHDKDPFNRFEAGQIYAVRMLLKLADDYRRNGSLAVPDAFINMYAHVLENDKQDSFLLSEMLYLPSEKYIGEQMQVIDVDAIHAVREFALRTIAEKLEPLFLKTYKAYHDETGNYHFSIEEVGKRQLKNRCLSYLTLLPKYTELAYQQFKTALNKNMTDTQPALAALTNVAEAELRGRVLNEFYITWKHDALVVDKWLAIQAASKQPNALQEVKKLMRHEAFDIKNPNKVYSLIGTFGQRNPVHFHAANGEGYAFLREVVHQLDKLNPQVSARMVKPLTTWRRYDKERQILMRKQLELLMQDTNLSKDLYELVSKSLSEV